MSDRFKFGDSVRKFDAGGGYWIKGTVLYCGTEKVFGRWLYPDPDSDVDGEFIEAEMSYAIHTVESVPVYPELWINVHTNLGVTSWSTRYMADGADRPRVAVIHLASDGTLTLEPIRDGCGVSGDVRGAA
jgi:hypothetical protein